MLRNDLLYLKRAGIKYCLLKDYLKAKEFNDVDILVSSRQKRKLRSVLRTLGYKAYQMHHTNVFYHKLIGQDLVQLHFHFNYFYDFIHTDDAFKRTYVSNSISILSKEDFAATLISKMRGGRPRQSYYLKQLLAIKKVDKGAVKKILSNKFVFDSIDAGSVLKGKKLSQLVFRTDVMRRKYLRRLTNVPTMLWAGIKAVFSPYDYVVFLGVDGSGKTTTTKNVAEYLKKRKFLVYTIYGGRFKFKFLPLNFLTERMAAKKKKTSKSEDVLHYQSRFIHYVTPLVYYIEYLLRYVFMVSWRKRRYHFILADRYFIDVIISPNTNTKFARFLYSIMPKPNKVIYLYNDLEKLVRRRGDHPKEDLARQLWEFKDNEDILDKKIKTKNEKQTLGEAVSFMFAK